MVDEELYRPPASDLELDQEVPSSRLAHCSIAWVSGFTVLPLASFALLVSASPDSQVSFLQSINAKDVLGFIVAGTISAAAVAPFRRLSFWLAMLSGFFPLVLFLLFALGMSIFGVSV
ncbi:MAG: hypothetical protein O9256_00535 [Rhizobiaceae bacterium]|nr:hypothetical protein [Rhizobiaceae bacterium]